MTLILPHRTRTARHTHIPWLWRATCSCGWSAFAAFEYRARAAANQHLIEEEPFPDLSPLNEETNFE